MKFKVRVETRNKETFVIEADNEKQAEDIAVDMSDGGMNATRVLHKRADPCQGLPDSRGNTR